MKRVLWFIAGLVSGVGLVLWWGGRKKYPPIDVEPLREWHRRVLEDSFNGFEYPNAGAPSDIEIIPCGDRLADTQPIRIDNA